MAFSARSSLFLSLLCLTPAACIAPVVIGGNASDTEGDAESGDSDGGLADEGNVPAAACPASPPEFACTVPFECGDFCGGVQSEFDDDGCLRPRCTSDADCPADRQCVRLGDWGGGAPSSTFCEMSGGTCQCGGTADGNEDIRVCMLTDDVPVEDPEICGNFGSEESFSWESGSVEPGDSSCTVMAVVPTLELECTGAIEGPASLVLSIAEDVPFSVDDEVDVEYLVEDGGAWPEQWLRIYGNGLTPARVVAAKASSITPPGETVEWWSDGLFDLERAELLCSRASCEGQPGFSRRPGAIRAGAEDVFEDFAPDTQGAIPGEFGALVPYIAVQQVHDGTCDGPDYWYSLSVVWIGG